MNSSIKIIFFIFIIFIGYYFFYIEYQKIVKFDLNHLQNQKVEVDKNKINETKKNEIVTVQKNKINLADYEKKDEVELKKISIKISKGDTFLSILNKYDIDERKIFEIINEINKFYDLKKLKVNDIIFFYFDSFENMRKIEINLNIDNILILNIDDNIIAEKKELERNTYQVSREYLISNSIYADGLNNEIPEDILIKIIRLFSFDLDFQRDIKKNTVVSVSYEFDQVKENNKIEYKDLNYALISINGKILEYFKFITDDGYIDYFNRDGKNVKKSILKTPLDGARLSSNFGMRKHPISGYNKMHKGVDFAAPKGTPIYAGGNGVVEYIGRNGGYGKYIRIRHNNEYKTAYAHLSGYKKGISKGSRVNQGDVIGYVGSTGNSTGPHLHYEIIFQNKHINPLKLKLPSGKVLEGNELDRFINEYKSIYANHLNLLYE